jgi:hypothetical protein
MLIRISIEQTEPLTGTAATATSRPLPFVGWLELLRAISELVDAAGGSTSAHGAVNSERPSGPPPARGPGSSSPGAPANHSGWPRLS